MLETSQPRKQKRRNNSAFCRSWINEGGKGGKKEGGKLTRYGGREEEERAEVVIVTIHIFFTHLLAIILRIGVQQRRTLVHTQGNKGHKLGLSNSKQSNSL